MRRMNQLVQRLSQGEHPVEVSLRPDRSLETLRECLDRGYVHVKFVSTKGGTELGVRLNRESCSLPANALETGQGTITIVGNLSLT